MNRGRVLADELPRRAGRPVPMPADCNPFPRMHLLRFWRHR